MRGHRATGPRHPRVSTSARPRLPVRITRPHRQCHSHLLASISEATETDATSHIGASCCQAVVYTTLAAQTCPSENYGQVGHERMSFHLKPIAHAVRVAPPPPWDSKRTAKQLLIFSRFSVRLKWSCRCSLLRGLLAAARLKTFPNHHKCVVFFRLRLCRRYLRDSYEAISEPSKH